MIINAFVKGQELKIYTPKLVANSVNHLDAEFNFLTSEWDGLKKWAHFGQGDTQYIFELRNDNIEKGDGLNLTEGKWNVWLHGSEVSEDLTEVTRITTEIAEIEVLPSGIVLGEPLPVVPPSFGEQLEKRVSKVEEIIAEGGIAGDCDCVSPTVELEELDNGHRITIYDKNNPNGNSFELFDGVGIEEIYEDIVINPDSLDAPQKHRLVFVLTNGQEYYTEYTVYRGIPGAAGADGADGRSPHIYVEDGYIKYNYGEHDGEQPIGGHDIISLDELMNYIFNESVANAVKGTDSGAVIRLDDVSPIEHTLSVKVLDDNIDPTTVTVRKYGKNLVNVSNEAFTQYKKIEFAYPLPPGTYTLSGYLETTDTDSDEVLLSFNLSNGNKVSKNFLNNSNRKNYPFTVGASITFVELYASSNFRLGEGDTAKWIDFQLEFGNVASDYEPYTEPTIHTALSDGIVEGITSIYPTMTLMSDTDGVIIECEYNRDTNKVIEELTESGGSIGGGSIGGDGVGGIITNAITTVESLPETGTEMQTVLLLEKVVDESSATISFKTPVEYPQNLTENSIEITTENDEDLILSVVRAADFGVETDVSEYYFTFAVPFGGKVDVDNDGILDSDTLIAFLPDCNFLGEPKTQGYYKVDTDTYELTAVDVANFPKFKVTSLPSEWDSVKDLYFELVEVEAETTLVNKGFYTFFNGKWEQLSFS